MAMNPMLATLLMGSMNKGQGPGNPGSIVDSLMSVLNGGDIDGVMKGIGFAGLMKELPRVMNAAMDWKSTEGGASGDMETPEDEGMAQGPMPTGAGPMPMPMGGMPMPPPMMQGGPPPGGMPGGNPMQALAALLAARRGAPAGPAPGGMPPLGDLMLRRG